MKSEQKQIAMRVESVTKSFRIPTEASNGIKQKLINLLNGKRGYREFTPLKDITFDIAQGDFFGIVGRNGSGKSTLLKTIAGIYTPNTGRVHVNGTLVPFIELGVGFNPELTGRENVYLNGSLLGFSRSEMDAMYESIVEFAELKDFMDERLKNYSSGMQVRLAFSIAIKAEADILLLDEVLAVGDAEFQRKCYDYFMSLKGRKQTVILVTHDMNAVRQYCDKAVMIEQGRIVKLGSAEEIAQEYQRLFTHNDEQEANGDSDLWGEGGMTVHEVRAHVDDDVVRVTTTYKATKDLPAPVYGFTLFNAAGIDVLEGNTLKENIKTRAVTRGEIITIEWELPNILSDGSYNLSAACCDRSTTKYYQWVNNAASFRVTKYERTAGVVDPNIKVTFKKGV